MYYYLQHSICVPDETDTILSFFVDDKSFLEYKFLTYFEIETVNFKNFERNLKL